MSKRTRRRHTPEQKAALIRQHLVDKKPVSEICEAAQRYRKPESDECTDPRIDVCDIRQFGNPSLRNVYCSAHPERRDAQYFE